MKCSKASIGMFSVIEACLRDIKADASTNTLEETLDLIEEQLNRVRSLEGITES